MFADDTQIINKTEKSIEESFRILNIYEKDELRQNSRNVFG
jgi:hypothetical protein